MNSFWNSQIVKLFVSNILSGLIWAQTVKGYQQLTLVSKLRVEIVFSYYYMLLVQRYLIIIVNSHWRAFVVFGHMCSPNLQLY